MSDLSTLERFLFFTKENIEYLKGVCPKSWEYFRGQEYYCGRKVKEIQKLPEDQEKIVDEMESFAKRHWMHEASQVVSDFAHRLRFSFRHPTIEGGQTK